MSEEIKCDWRDQAADVEGTHKNGSAQNNEGSVIKMMRRATESSGGDKQDEQDQRLFTAKYAWSA